VIDSLTLSRTLDPVSPRWICNLEVFVSLW